MSKSWYPVIDYSLCTECGTCVNMCCHSVYDLKKAPVPVVVNPQGCVQGCKGCGSKCPYGAITYVGDIGTGAGEPCSCGCSDGKGGSCC